MRSTKGQSGTGIPLRLAKLVLRWDHSSPTPPLAAWLNPQARAITLRVMAAQSDFRGGESECIHQQYLRKDVSVKRRKNEKTN